MLLNSVGVSTTGTTSNQLSFKAADKSKFLSMINGIMNGKSQQETSETTQKEDASLQGLADLLTGETIASDKLAESLTAIQQLLAANGEEGKDDSDSLETAFSLVVNQLMELMNKMDFSNVSDEMFSKTNLPELLNQLKAIEQVAGQNPDFKSSKQLTDVMQSLSKLLTTIMQAVDGQSQSTSASLQAAAMLQKEAATDMAGAQGEKASVIEEDGQTGSLKTLIDSIAQKVEALSKKQDNPDTLPKRLLNPLLVGSLQKTESKAITSSQDTNTETKEKDTTSKSEWKMPSYLGQLQTNSSFGKPEALTLMQSSGKSVSGSELEDQLENILKSSSFTKIGNTQKMILRLAPENLGSLRIEILQTDGNLVAKIMTTTAQAKDALDAHLNSLKQGLSSQNINVDKIEINFVPTSQEKETKDQQQQENHQQHRPAEKEENRNEQEQDDKSFLEELLQAEQ
ncbi:flagellar hook-length control protein FliK [Niallia circulans]|uniref:Flagellar hook-length control protein FliK n=1 Tax=Niallia circulans TaxID=1397 RepID=A0A553SP16_NIACI|nr:flagellar hook-length control protein FliK [Niallia circulans]TRZ38721.1 flagellar hook-length control protein FliK [Niallia circulans]